MNRILKNHPKVQVNGHFLWLRGVYYDALRGKNELELRAIIAACEMHLARLQDREEVKA